MTKPSYLVAVSRTRKQSPSGGGGRGRGSRCGGRKGRPEGSKWPGQFRRIRTQNVHTKPLVIGGKAVLEGPSRGDRGKSSEARGGGTRGSPFISGSREQGGRKLKVEGEETGQFKKRGKGQRKEDQRSHQAPEEKGGEGILDLEDFKLLLRYHLELAILGSANIPRF